MEALLGILPAVGATAGLIVALVIVLIWYVLKEIMRLVMFPVGYVMGKEDFGSLAAAGSAEATRTNAACSAAVEAYAAADPVDRPLLAADVGYACDPRARCFEAVTHGDVDVMRESCSSAALGRVSDFFS